MSREGLRRRRGLRLALEQWLINGYLPVAHIVAELDLPDDLVPLGPLQRPRRPGSTSFGEAFDTTTAVRRRSPRRGSARLHSLVMCHEHAARTLTSCR